MKNVKSMLRKRASWKGKWACNKRKTCKAKPDCNHLTPHDYREECKFHCEVPGSKQGFCEHYEASGGMFRGETK